MVNLGILFLLSGALCLMFTPLARTLAMRLGLVDTPDGERKIHDRPVPTTGGLAVFLALFLALGLVGALPASWLGRLGFDATQYQWLLLAATVIVTVGVLDDCGYLRGRHKLLGQIGAIGVVLASGTVVREVHVFGWTMELGLLAMPFTAFWLLGAINSLNLIDGMDGLLTSMGLILALAIAAMALIGGQMATACVAVALAGALLGFLRFNFPPASVFLGDSGSMLIGLVIGVLAIRSSLKGPATVALTAPIAILAIPIFDTAAAITRRKLTGRSIYTTDRGHLHHCLLGRGLTSRRVLLCITAVCSTTALGALASLALHNELIALFTCVLVVAIFVLTKVFGHAEFLLAKARLRAMAISLLRPRIPHQSHESQVRLQGSADWNELWRLITDCAPRLRLLAVSLDVNVPRIHEGYHARWHSLESGREAKNEWRLEIPLASNGHTLGRLNVTGHCDQQPVSEKIAVLSTCLEQFEILSLLDATEKAVKVRPPELNGSANGNGDQRKVAEGNSGVYHGHVVSEVAHLAPHSLSPTPSPTKL